MLSSSYPILQIRPVWLSHFASDYSTVQKSWLQSLKLEMSFLLSCTFFQNSVSQICVRSLYLRRPSIKSTLEIKLASVSWWAYIQPTLYSTEPYLVAFLCSPKHTCWLKLGNTWTSIHMSKTFLICKALGLASDFAFHWHIIVKMLRLFCQWNQTKVVRVLFQLKAFMPSAELLYMHLRNI